MICRYYENKEGILCGEPAEIKYHVPVCPDHSIAIFLHRSFNANGKIHELVALNPSIIHAPGQTYIIGLPNGRVKIGFTAGETMGLLKRYQDISRENRQKVNPLATIKGGWTMESLLHYRFNDSRVAGKGEQFTYSGELFEFISSTGQTPEGLAAFTKLHEWQPTTF